MHFDLKSQMYEKRLNQRKNIEVEIQVVI